VKSFVNNNQRVFLDLKILILQFYKSKNAFYLTKASNEALSPTKYSLAVTRNPWLILLSKI